MIINNNINSLLNLPQDTTSVQDKKPVSVEIKSTSSETRYTGSTEKELRMAELKMQISDGTYNIDFTKLAQKVVSTEYSL